MDRLPDVEIVALQDSAPETMAHFAKRHAAKARQYRDWRELLDRERLDMVGTCGTNGARAEIVLECAKRKLHVIAEKPLAINVADMEKIKKAVADSGVRLTMLIPMRFEPEYRALKQIVDSGEIGEIAQISAQKSYKLGERAEWMRHRATYGGTIPYIAVHMVDLMRWSSGREFLEVISFQGRVGHPELRDMENTTASIFRLDNGGTAALHMDYLRPDTAPGWGDDRLRLAGTHGVAEYMAATGVTLVTGKKQPQQIRELPARRSLFVDFLESVYLGRRAGLSLEDIYRVNDIVLAARDSADAHRIQKI
jgi:predicted dehydrogenase